MPSTQVARITTAIMVTAALILFTEGNLGFADQDWCDKSTGGYDHYPGPSSDYAQGSVTTYPWRGSQDDYPDGTEGFEHYAHGERIDCGDSSSSQRSYLNTTAGCLSAQHVTGTTTVYRRGWIDSDIFRVVADGWADFQRVMWGDQRVRYRALVKAWTTPSNNQGLSVFSRYRTEDDLYVASYKRNGRVFIKRKLCGCYTTLAKTQGVPMELDAWYELEFRVVTDPASGLNKLTAIFTPPADLGPAITLTAVDDTDASAALSYGTHGIRTDKLRAYIDDWQLSAP